MSKTATANKKQKRGANRPTPNHIDAAPVSFGNLSQDFLRNNRGTFLGGLLAFGLMLPFGATGLVALCVVGGVMMAISTEFIQSWQM